MSINIGPPLVDELKPKISVIGVGGAGGNAVGNMINAGVEGVDFIVTNTDAQALNSSGAEQRIQLGPDITQGLGAGSRPEVGRAAAEETIDLVKSAIEGSHMCFIAAGMGGGTGTGAAPVIAEAARDMNILTVGVVTKPFLFEGARRMRACEAGIAELQQHVDTLIVIPNQNLFLVANPNTTFKEAFLLADEVLQQGVRGITDLMVMPGLINLDFADVRSVMHEMGKAMMGTGEAEGDGRALEAAEKAIANPLLDGVSMQGAKGVIVSITGGEDMRLMEVDEAANHIRELVDPDANIIWGSAFNNNLDGKIRVSVVATGIDVDGSAPAPTPSPSSAFANSAPPASAAATSSLFASPASSESAAEEEAPTADDGDSDEAEDSEDGLDLSSAEGDDELPVEEAEDVEDNTSDDGESADSEETLELGAEQEDAAEGEEPTTDEPDLEPEPDSPAPRIASGGGTLFERMSNLSRGVSRDDDGDDDNSEKEKDEDKSSGGLNIPRFLDRQSNS
ncbi:MAG: cell division protein FtsZ [Sphingorhabdus sp.]